MRKGRFPRVEKEIVSEEKDKPVFDEPTLAKLLEAAYVLQEHNRELQEMELGLELKRDALEAEERSTAPPAQRAPQPPPAQPAAPADYTFTLAKIVETQHQIQVRHLELDNAMALAVERLSQIARANGAAIAILEGKLLRYRAVSGTLTLPSGSEVPMDKALSTACLRTGQVFRCHDVNPEFLLDTEECRRRGIQSMIAVPIFHDGAVTGAIELYYPTTQAFTEQDVHTCQLMAGLVTEALARNEEVGWKKSLATERAVMLEALEKLKPNLAAMVEKPAKRSGAGTASSPSESAAPVACRKCGHQIMREEQFCGNCGTARSSDDQPSDRQSTEATLRQMQEAMKNIALPEMADDAPALRELKAKLDQAHSEGSLADSLEEEMPDLFTVTGLRSEETESTQDSTQNEMPVVEAFDDSIVSEPVASEETEPHPETEGSESTALVKPERSAAWSSAASAREFLEQLAMGNRPGALARFWNARRGDIYLAVAVLLVAAVVRWGIWSSHSVGATGNTATAAVHHKAAPEPDLSLFERILVKLGLAEAPAPPESKGNPDTQVWVDLRTALYYCPGADLYGKTPKGKFTSQRDAQLDSFEPAYRKTCD